MSDVTQADREAGWLFRPTCYHTGNKGAWMAGVYDGNKGCPNTAFAAHRIAAEKAVLDRLRHITGDALAYAEGMLLRDDSDFTIPPRKDAVRYCASLADALETKR